MHLINAATLLTKGLSYPIILHDLFFKGGYTVHMDSGDSCPDPERINTVTLFKYRC